MPTRRTPALAALAALAIGASLLLTGCGGSDSSAATPGNGGSMSASMSTGMSMSPGKSMSSGASGSASTITIRDFNFGGAVTVAPGATVTVVNDDSETHSVTADGDGGFDVTVPPGDHRTFAAPSRPGSYPFHCMFHSDMHGTLRVR